MKRLLIGLALVLLAAGAASADAYPDPGTGVLFPKRLAGLSRGDVTVYPEPGLGRSFAYSGRDLEATVYVYNLGLPEIPAGIDSDEVRGELEDAKDSIQTRGFDGVVEAAGDVVVQAGPSDSPITMLRSTFRITGHEGLMHSYVFLFAESNNFVKVRYSCVLSEKKCEKRVADFTEALVGLFFDDDRETIPRETYVRMTESLIEDPYQEHADALRTILYVYADRLRPEFVLCLSQFSPLLGDNMEKNMPIIQQIAISSGAYLVQDPDKFEDPPSYQLAGLEGALRIYENMLAETPEFQNEFLDGLIVLRDDGRLGEHVQEHMCED